MKGYSLVELLVVVALIALMTTIASLYLFRRERPFALQIAAGELTSCLRRTHAKAISINKPQAVTLDLDIRHFSSSCCGGGQFPPGSQILFKTAASEFIRDRKASFRFFGDGTATGGNVFLKERGQIWAIRVNWLSGDVRLARETQWPES